MPEFVLKQTCGACPEAYNVYRNGKYVGCFRERYGGFTAHNSDHELVHECECDNITPEILNDACAALLEDIKSRQTPDDEPEPVYEIKRPGDDGYDDD